MADWFKNYGVVAVLLGSALVGGTVWMVEKEVEAQTAKLQVQIEKVALQQERNSDALKANSEALKAILAWVKQQQAKQKPAAPPSDKR